VLWLNPKLPHKFDIENLPFQKFRRYEREHVEGRWTEVQLRERVESFMPRAEVFLETAQRSLEDTRKQVSEVVGSEYGFHLFKVLDRRPAEQRSLQKVRGEVEKLLLQKKREAAQRRTLLELRAGPEAAGACKSARGDGGQVTDESVAACLKAAGEAHIQINDAVLAQVP